MSDCAKGHAALTTDVLAELVVSESRGRSVGTRDFLFGQKNDDDILSQQATAAALKTERERTKVPCGLRG